jgi:hypothetical protein
MSRDGLLSDDNERKISAAIASGRIPPGRAAYYRQRAREGLSLDVLATLQPVFAADGSALRSAAQPGRYDEDAIYGALYPSVQASRDAADRQLLAIEAASADPATEQEIYEAVFGKGTWAGADR